jgi:hypothetical protein
MNKSTTEEIAVVVRRLVFRDRAAGIKEMEIEMRHRVYNKKTSRVG